MKSDNPADGASWLESKWLSKCAAAKYIHRSPAALQKMLDAGVIPAVRAPFSRGGAPVVYVSIDDLDKYMRSTPYVPEGAGPERVQKKGAAGDAKRRGLVDISEIPAYRAIAHKGRGMAS